MGKYLTQTEIFWVPTGPYQVLNIFLKKKHGKTKAILETINLHYTKAPTGMLAVAVPIWILKSD